MVWSLFRVFDQQFVALKDKKIHRPPPGVRFSEDSSRSRSKGKTPKRGPGYMTLRLLY